MKQKIHLLKVCISHTVILFVSFLLIFQLSEHSLSLASHTRKEHQISSRSPYHTMCGQFRAYQVNQLLDTIRLGSPITPTGMRVVSYIHAQKVMYVLLSSSTMALRNFLPIAVYDDAFFQEFTVVNQY